MCIHHDGSLNHYKGTNESWTQSGQTQPYKRLDWIGICVEETNVFTCVGSNTLVAEILLYHTHKSYRPVLHRPGPSRFLSVRAIILIPFNLLDISPRLHIKPNFWTVCNLWTICSDFCLSLCRDVLPHVMYTYQVQTISGWSESEPSPPLEHELGAPYCGDGRIQR